MTKCIVLKFYEDGKYLPDYTKLYSYDLDDDNSFNEAFVDAACKLRTICSRNPNIFGRIENF